jgi:hypothetical protein
MFTTSGADAVPPGAALTSRLAKPVAPSFSTDWTVAAQLAHGASGAVQVVPTIRK